VLGDIVERCGSRTDIEGAPEYYFPTPEQILTLETERLSMPISRQATLMEVARFYAAGLDQQTAKPWSELLNIRGVGPWTVDMVAMRGYGQPDIMPASDLVLVKAASALGIAANAGELTTAANAWKPWRAYAANLLWRSLS